MIGVAATMYMPVAPNESPPAGDPYTSLAFEGRAASPGKGGGGGRGGGGHTQAQLLALVMRSGEGTSKRVPLIQKINRGEITSVEQLAEHGLTIDPAGV